MVCDVFDTLSDCPFGLHPIADQEFVRVAASGEFVGNRPAACLPLSYPANFPVVEAGDEYEDHWLEVVSVQDRKAQTIFSGLGYYL